jgi:glycosyltransferase involved in cell wall biosynthesis
MELEKISNIKTKTKKENLRKRFSISPTEKIIGTVGRFFPWKRQDLLLKITRRLLDKNINLKCLLVGSAENNAESRNWEKDLVKLIKSLDLEKTVISTGFIASPMEVMQLLDVFVLPSIYEPFGMVILESMALGIPVVAFNGGGPSEIITDKIDGVLVPSGNIDKMTEEVENLLVDKNLHNNISLNAPLTIQSKFNLSTTVKEYSKLYKNILKRDSNE